MIEIDERVLSKLVAINHSLLQICLNLPRVWSELCSARPGWFLVVRKLIPHITQRGGMRSLDKKKTHTEDNESLDV